jgi:hypothetical protein
MMLKYLLEALEPMFIIPPAILINLPKTTDEFLLQLAKSAGPVFIVLDEIGAAYRLKNVFFVLPGRASFLSYVGRRPRNMKLIQSAYIYF